MFLETVNNMGHTLRGSGSKRPVYELEGHETSSDCCHPLIFAPGEELKNVYI
jgi:hypothetical protein